MNTKNKILILMALFATSFAFSYEVNDFVKDNMVTEIDKRGKTKRVEVSDVVDPKHRVTLVEFYASWCGACNKNMPHLKELNDSLGSKMTIRLVAQDSKRGALNFLRKHARFIDYPVSYDEESNLIFKENEYNVKSLPTTFLIDESGRVLYRHLGVLNFLSKRKIKSIVNRL